MKLIDPHRNLYETSEKELLKLKYSKVNLSNIKDSFKDGDYLMIEQDRWAVISSTTLRKTQFFKEIQHMTLYRKL